MAQRGQQTIQIGDRVRSSILPGVSDRDYITGFVVGWCEIGGVTRVIIESLSRVTHGQEDPCRRRFFEPLDGVTVTGRAPRALPTLPRVA